MRQVYHAQVARPTRKRTLRALNPLRGFVEMGAGASDTRVATAIGVARGQRPALSQDDADWFGWGLPDEPRHRYAAVGCQDRGFVVDVVSGHVIWEGPIEGRRGLPRSIADTAKRA
jgi:hypothetical protein